MKSLKNKVVLITGGDTGIGRACALLFAEQGAEIAICSQRQDVLENTCEVIEQIGVRATYVSGDIGKSEDIRKIVDHAVDRLGGVDCLINNASIVDQVGPVEELDLDKWEDALRINLTGSMLCSQRVIPHIEKARRRNDHQCELECRAEGISESRSLCLQQMGPERPHSNPGSRGRIP
jgi:NAD(P)-dependent dehydrogenase (short-subunit alcohol dehydrogenase family)